LSIDTSSTISGRIQQQSALLGKRSIGAVEASRRRMKLMVGKWIRNLNLAKIVIIDVKPKSAKAVNIDMA
jgi:hypothetical protein